MRNASRLVGAAVLVAGLVVVPSTPAAAAGTTSVPLPIDRAEAMVLDEAHGRLFVSGGPGRSEVLVTDLAGTELRRVGGLPGASGLLLDGDTLYVALYDAQAVAAVDTGTLQETGRWALPADTCPDELALTAGRLVFTATTCNNLYHDGWLGTLDRSSGATTREISTSSRLVIAANPASGGLVAVGDAYGSPSQVLLYDVTGDQPAVLRASEDRYDVEDVAMSPDGRSLFVSGNDGGFRLPLDTLAFGLSVTPSAVATWSAADTLVTGSGGQLLVWPEGGTHTTSGVTAPYGTNARHGLLAVDRAGSRGWVVSTEYDFSSPALVRYDLAPVGTAWTLSAPRTVQPAHTSGTLRADLRVGGQPVEDGVRLVVGVRLPDGSTTSEVHYTRGGGISLSLFPERGLTRYWFSHGDDTHGTAKAYADVIGTYETVLSTSVEPESPLYPDSYLAWYAYLTDTEGRALEGRRIELTRTDAAGTEKVAEAYTDGYGRVSFQIEAGQVGTFTYTLRYAGDVATSPSEHTTVVTVEKKDSYVWVEASRGTGRAGRTATVVGHLGGFHTNRTLTITATPDGGTPQVIAQGEVDENLTLTVQYPMKRDTTFTVSYAGDDWYAAGESSTRLTLR